jgi:glycine/D-amino acid oxidase-like deaminating enzyme
MSGYMEPLNNPPATMVYFGKKNQLNSDPTGESYFYMTRRPHDDLTGESHNLICAGGPEKVLPNGADYSKEHESEDYIQAAIDDFLRENYRQYPQNNAEHAFFWHGLMGYTPNGIRRIGVEPLNPALLYNLGCNGIGILPSIYGGKRISQILAGEKLEKSIFDPGVAEIELTIMPGQQDLLEQFR